MEIVSEFIREYVALRGDDINLAEKKALVEMASKRRKKVLPRNRQPDFVRKAGPMRDRKKEYKRNPKHKKDVRLAD